MWVVSIAHECEVRQVVFLMKPISIECVHEHKMEAQWLRSAIVPDIINIFAGTGLTANTRERGIVLEFTTIFIRNLLLTAYFQILVEEDQITSCKWHCLAAAIYRQQCTITNFWGIHIHTFDSTTACSLFLFLCRLWYAGRQLAFLKRWWCNMHELQGVSSLASLNQ